MLQEATETSDAAGKLVQIRVYKLNVSIHSCFCNGKPQNENGSACRAIIAGDLAAVVLHDAIGGAQSQACAFPDGLGGVEGVKDAIRFRDSGTSVRELDHYFVCILISVDGKRSTTGVDQCIARVTA